MLSEIVRIGDIVYFRNGQFAEIGRYSLLVLDKYYVKEDTMLKTKFEGLKCPSNSDYDIIKITRPVYETIFEAELEKGDENTHVRKNR